MIKWQPWDVQQEVQLFLAKKKKKNVYWLLSIQMCGCMMSINKTMQVLLLCSCSKVPRVQEEFKEVWRRCKPSWRKEGRRRPSELENERVGAKFPLATKIWEGGQESDASLSSSSLQLLVLRSWWTLGGENVLWNCASHMTAASISIVLYPAAAEPT